MIHASSPPLLARRGLSMAEVLVAVAVASVVMVCGMQLMFVAHRQGRTVDAQRVAWLEAGNLMEHVMARPWEDMHPDVLSSLALSDACRQALPDAILRVDALPDDTDPTALQITIEIQWRADASRPAVPVRLVAWRYRTLEVAS
jgi:prepilin-type N-terminal cleavage/methylation domain-containing protein